eukprot:NODE_190_length_15503_cov_0.365814.p8 type:complete len:160 gc:universal NODE_190_length_15503_cov_0.365814:7407-6928(-)
MIFSSSLFAFQVTITAPKGGEVWKRNQTSGAMIEWLEGDKPKVPAGFPTALDLYYVDAATDQKVEQITNFNPSVNARWFYSPNDPISTNLTDGDYKVLLVNSNDHADIAYTPTFTIKGGPLSGTPVTPVKPTDTSPPTNLFSSASTVSHLFLLLAAFFQ